ncbi:MAG TPA: DUF1501 domain-containing protein [Verrucomicrobia bacterium]|nr:DUF1501 domain-containing protein [Verrucomicrobiales bacterium]HIL55942.1 DUF1501 domain-containing protein [Verrucomicrobiota bacterium]
MKRHLCVGEESTFGMSRRGVLNRFGMGLGGIAMSEMMSNGNASAAGFEQKTHLPAKVKRVIYLFQSGGPSQMDLYDHKPILKERHGEQLPEEVRKGQRLTGMSGNQSSFPLAGSPFKFSQHGESGQWMSEILPHTAKVADELCVVKSMHTEAINHGPGVTMLQTGSQFPGRPSIGAWLSYGLGSANNDLPTFVVMVTKNKGGQPLVSRLWGSGFLPSEFQGVRLRSGKDPVLYLNNPNGITRVGRRKMLDKLVDLHRLQVEKDSDPLIEGRIAEYELAYRMQSSVPEVTDISDEPKHILDLYGKGVSNPGSFAANCLQARRLAERGVRYIQLYHPGWDQHGGLAGGIKGQCSETDQASAALVTDLKQRGLLDDTLVIWGGEFGRTNYCQGKLNGNNFGRDHHPRCFSLWMAGGGVKAGTAYGSTDPLGYNVQKDPVHVHDFHATMLHLLGIDHERLTFKYQGRRFRLTDVHGRVVKGILA